MDLTEHIVGPIKCALLCATANTDKDNGSALTSFLGRPLIAHQVDALRKQGVELFLIEVDVISGPLLALLDHYRSLGTAIEFVRSPKDLLEKLGSNAVIMAQAEAIVASDMVLARVLDPAAAVIVTLDGREGNARFERIDLNTHWAGLAVIESRSISAIAALPPGYSISSSLLRQALQDATKRDAIPQDYVEHRDLVRIATPEDAASLERAILQQRGQAITGWLERKTIGRFASNITPLIWQTDTVRHALDAILFLTPILVLIASYFQAALISASLAILSIIALIIKGFSTNQQAANGISRFGVIAIFSLLAASLLLLLWHDDFDPIGSMLSGYITVALAIYHHYLAGQGKTEGDFFSPLMIAVTMFALMFFTSTLSAVRVILFLQSLTLLSLIKPRKRQ